MNPSPVSLSAAAGATLYLGRSAPAGPVPLWLQGKAVNEWFSIPGTAGAGGAAAQPYCGWAYNKTDGQALFLAAGGHGDSSDDRVVGINLRVDHPTWVTLLANSGVTNPNQPYSGTIPNRRPTSRHTYWSSIHVPALNRVLNVGAMYVSGLGVNHPIVDGFRLDTNQWDPEGTWAYSRTLQANAVYGVYPGPTAGVYPDDVTNGYHAYGSTYQGAVLDANGFIWAQGGKAKMNATTGIWTEPTTGGPELAARAPWCYDSTRRQVVGLSYDQDGTGPSLKPLLNTVNIDTHVMRSITINPGAVLTQWIADAPTEAAMDYDPVNDCFAFCNGYGSPAGRLYIIKPNATLNWDMSILTLGGGSIAPPATLNSGIMSRFSYDPVLKCFIGMPRVDSDMVGIKLSV